MSTQENGDEKMTEQLLRCELTLLDPMVRKDRAAISAFLARDFFEFGASGKLWTRDEILDLLETETYTPPVIEDFSCKQIAEGVALVTYRAARTDAATGERSFTHRSSIWTRHADRWVVRFHQGTRAL